MADEKAVIQKSFKEAQYDATAKMLLAQKMNLSVEEFAKRMEAAGYRIPQNAR